MDDGRTDRRRWREAMGTKRTVRITLAFAITAAACTAASEVGSALPPSSTPASTAVPVDRTYGLGKLPELPTSTIESGREIYLMGLEKFLDEYLLRPRKK